MAGHKLTQLGHPAGKKIQTYLTSNQNLFNNESQRRLAYADGVIAISGATGLQLARDLYGIDVAAPELLDRFNAMLHTFGYAQALGRTADLCAEGRLWITLTGLHSRSAREGLPPRHQHGHPRHPHVWVYEIDRKNRPKEDSPCENCRQWVRGEFLTLNGTSG
ncbi:MAG: hypothetical protein M3552_08725 [Planctomycetota bacterium]|nr:hypothetical protein [Planctomycetaceae bacterium]MDQ3330725.1 hypothetical protein [Planctomycetota bacterium]